MAEIELTDIFKNRWSKRIIFLLILGALIYKFYPDVFFWFNRSSLDRSTRVIVETIKMARTYTMNHEDSYAADFNLQDNTFVLVYPRRRNSRERKLIGKMRVLPEGIDIIKCTFTALIIEGPDDPDSNQLIFRIRFDKRGNSYLESSSIWVGNRFGQVREIAVTNPAGKIKIYKHEGEVDFED